MTEKTPKIWTTEWPEKFGWFWFYGDPFGAKEINPEHVRYYAVRVAKTANSWARICEGHFMYEAEASEGLWSPMVMPEVPSLCDLSKLEWSDQCLEE